MNFLSFVQIKLQHFHAEQNEWINDVRQEKTDHKVFVAVIPKEGWSVFSWRASNFLGIQKVNLIASFFLSTHFCDQSQC